MLFLFLASEATPLRECRRGWRYFWILPDVCGCGFTSGPTLKKALCYICLVVGRRTNKVHQSACHNHMWYHLRSGQIVTPHWTRNFLSTNYYLTRFTWILFLLLEYICFSINPFLCSPCRSFVGITTLSNSIILLLYCIYPALLSWVGEITQGEFLRGLNLALLLLTDSLTRAKELNLPCSKLKKEHINSCLSQRYYRRGKYKYLRSGFVLGRSFLFLSRQSLFSLNLL